MTHNTIGFEAPPHYLILEIFNFIVIFKATFMGHPSIKITCVFRPLFGACVYHMYHIGHPSKKLLN